MDTTTTTSAPAATQPEAFARLLAEFAKLKARPDERNLKAFEGLLVVAAQDAALSAPAAQEAEPAAHPDDYAVDRFAAAMKDKLAAARAKGRGGWETAKCTQERLSTMLREHVEKGDPRDVANFCVFLWNRGERIGQPVVTAADGERYAAEFFKTKGYLPSIAQAYAAGTVRGGIASPCDASLLAAAPQAPAAATAAPDDDAMVDKAWSRFESAMQQPSQEPPPVSYADHEREVAAEVDQREQAEHVIDLLCDAVLGPDRPDWSNSYGYQSAINDVAQRIADLERRAAPAAAVAPADGRPGGDLWAEVAALLRKYLKLCKEVGRGDGHHRQRVGQAISAVDALPAAPTQEAVAYLDIGAGGYVDVGTDLAEEQLAALPKGRHMLAIIGTYGIAGYTPAQVDAAIDAARARQEGAQHER